MTLGGQIDQWKEWGVTDLSVVETITHYPAVRPGSVFRIEGRLANATLHYSALDLDMARSVFEKQVLRIERIVHPERFQ
jgi:hypothetical protein